MTVPKGHSGIAASATSWSTCRHLLAPVGTQDEEISRNFLLFGQPDCTVSGGRRNTPGKELEPSAGRC